MKLPGPAEWLFSIRTFAAAMTALYIAFAINLDRPYWALASVYIASQPLSGATRSKALYRALGTVLGAAVAVALIPNLVDAPVLLCLAMAGWIALCLYFGLLDRTPRSYLFILGGYSAALIGFPTVDTPGTIWDTAVARVEEITLGIACASVFASVVFPRHVGPVLAMRLSAWRANAQSWCRDALAGRQPDQATDTERRRLAGDIGEIDLLTSYLAWDPAAQPDAVRGLRAMRLRMLMALPAVSSLADRVRGLRETGPLRPDIARLLAEADTWINAGDAGDRAERLRLLAVIHAADVPLDATAGWSDLLLASLLARLRDVLDLVQDLRTLRRHVTTGDRFPEVLAFHRAGAASDIRHHDHGRAIWSGASAALATLICCVFWIGAAWPDGGTAAELCAVACAFFAAQDDPVPAIMSFLTWGVVGVIVDGVLLFGVLPAAHSYEMLVLALAPSYLLSGALAAMPATAPIGAGLTVIGSSLLGLTDTYNASFAPFVNGALALIFGVGTAAVVTAVVRSVGADWSAWQLLRRNWIDVAEAAERRGSGDRTVFAALMLDRVGLVAPRIAAVSPGSELRAVDLLLDVRVGLNIVSLRRARRRLPDACRQQLEALLDGLAAYYRARAWHVHRPPPDDLLALLDEAVRRIAAAPQTARMRDAALALVGIRRALFPTAAPYQPAPPALRIAA